MKYCPKCGEENNNGAKFCKSCGNSFEENNSNTASTNNANSGLGTASLVIGIIALVLSFTCVIFVPIFLVFPLAIVGLILGIVNKVRKGKSVAGIVLNAVAIFLSLIFSILFIAGISFFGIKVEEEAKRRGTDINTILDEIFDRVDSYEKYDYVE